MKKLAIFSILAAAIFMLTSQTPTTPPPPQGGPPQGAPPPGFGGGRREAPPVNQDSLNKEKEKALAAVMESIKGKEKMPADSVFKNIKLFKGMPVERMLGIMNNGWSKALGVGCNGCHNVNDYASEEKEEKQLAREMSAMTQKLNKELIKTIKGLEKANVGCNTCHRGKKHP